jgi:hypothetical protein
MLEPGLKVAGAGLDNSTWVIRARSWGVAWVVMWRKNLGAMWREWGLPRGAL